MSATAVPSPEIERPTVPKAPVTFEEFLAWADEDSRAEWVDGEIIVMSPASLDHQDLLFFLGRVIAAYVEAHRRGRVFLAPILMRLPTRPSGREPDLLFVSNEHADRLHPTYVDGPADLVVEIVSPDSVERDRRDKYLEYEAAGVPEYWLLDPDQRRADFFCLGPEGRYHAAPVDETGVFRSRVVPGFWLRVAWLWQEPLPELEAVRELGLLDGAPATSR